MEMELSVENDEFFIDNVNFSKDSKLITNQDAESEMKLSHSYTGPTFSELDEELQGSFHEFLQERGFTKQFAQFIPSYVEFKEQNEYVRWLDNLNGFVRK